MKQKTFVEFMVAFLTDDEGNPSSQRAIKFGMALTYCWMWINHSIHPLAPTPDALLTGAVISIAGIGAIQKRIETIATKKKKK